MPNANDDFMSQLFIEFKNNHPWNMLSPSENDAGPAYQELFGQTSQQSRTLREFHRGGEAGRAAHFGNNCPEKRGSPAGQVSDRTAEFSKCIRPFPDFPNSVARRRIRCLHLAQPVGLKRQQTKHPLEFHKLPPSAPRYIRATRRERVGATPGVRNIGLSIVLSSSGTG